MTVTELVEAAGVARASFYRNFASVEELVDYGIRQVTERYHAGKPEGREGFRDRALVEYKFRFYAGERTARAGFPPREGRQRRCSTSSPTAR